jgi:hypothetical protein
LPRSGIIRSCRWSGAPTGCRWSGAGEAADRHRQGRSQRLGAAQRGWTGPFRISGR